MKGDVWIEAPAYAAALQRQVNPYFDWLRRRTLDTGWEALRNRIREDFERRDALQVWDNEGGR